MKKTLRRMISFVLIFMLVSSLFSSLAFAATSQTMNDDYGTWEYVVEADGSVTLIGFTSNGKKNIVVPTKIDGKPVHKLDNGLFADRNDLTMIVVPEGIVEIGDNVFNGCKRLEKVELPTSSLTSIGDSAFANCDKLEEVFIPASVETFGSDIFQNSPIVEVTCGMNTAAAQYVKANKNQVANYKLVEITGIDYADSTPASAVAPAEPDPTPTAQLPHPMTTPSSGKQVAYKFGSTVNGNPEYVVYLNDSLPDLNLMQYVKMDQTTNSWVFDSSVQRIASSRFTLDSVWHYNSETSSYENTSSDYRAIGQQSVSYTFINDGGVPVPTITYSLHLDWNASSGTLLNHMKFDSDNNLVLYSESNSTVNGVTTKNQNTYADINQETGIYQAKNADGTVSETSVAKNSDSHIYALGMKACGYIATSNAIITAADGSKVINDQIQVRLVENIKNSILASHTEEKDANGNPVYSNGFYNKTTDGKIVDNESKSITYMNNGEEDHYFSSTKQTESGAYEAETASLNSQVWEYDSEQHQTESGTTTDYKYEDAITTDGELYYRDVVIQTEDATTATAAASTNFPNNADERTDYISDQSIQDLNRTNDITRTNLQTGAVDQYVVEEKSSSMQDHTYIGNTGKFVGWDWYWDYMKQNEDNPGTTVVNEVQHYEVTEYSYDASSNEWTKTAVQVDAKDGGEKNVDFKTIMPTVTDLLQNYYVNSQKYLYVETLDSGADNWLQVVNYSVSAEKNTEDNTISEYTNYVENDSSTDLISIQDKITTNAETGEVIETYPTITPESSITTEKAEALIKEEKQETVAIIMGTDTVTADGTVIQQSDEKQEMLDTEAAVSTELNNLDTESFVEEVMEQIPDGNVALQEMQASDLPQATEDNVSHEHLADGSGETTVIPE